MQVERARASIEITREILQMNPATARNRLRGVADAHAEFRHCRASRNIDERDLVPARDRLAHRKRRRIAATADKLYGSARNVLEERRDVVAGVNLKTAGGHFRLGNSYEPLCHSERSEESTAESRATRGFFASLRMTIYEVNDRLRAHVI